MKKYIITVLLFAGVSTQVMAQNVWVSDEIEAPLRASPELNADIVGMLPAGQQVVAINQKKDYVQIKTPDGQKGWLSSYYVLRQESVHAQLAPLKKELATTKAELQKVSAELASQNSEVKRLETDVEQARTSANKVAKRAKDSEVGVTKLTGDNERLQKELSSQSEKMTQLAQALDVAKQKATDARARYLSLVKVSENVVEIDKQNRSLQERAVQFEQELQQLKTENQTLKSQIGKKEFLIGALTILGGVLIGYVLSVLMPPRGRRSGGYSSL